MAQSRDYLHFQDANLDEERRELENSSIPMSRIAIAPMPQRSEVRDLEEDWTGKSSTAIRRKLQNRLNKRASRKRKTLGTQTEQEPDYSIQIYKVYDTAPLNEAVAHFQKLGPDICMHHDKRKAVTNASNFNDYVLTPLPVDQKLLTLLHFNLVRALTSNIILLGCNPDEMYLDLNSPFAPDCGLPSANPSGVSIQGLPPTLRPTTLQLTVPHHPEIDVFPFPQYRDNLILAGSTIDDVELCCDMLYGVELNDNLEKSTKLQVTNDMIYGWDGDKYTQRSSKGKKRCEAGPFGGSGRTGLIVWADPWLQESWEVDEGFARKYKRLFRGCDALMRSTNHWRANRGEKRLVLED